MHATFTVFWLNIAFIAVHSGERCGPWASGLKYATSNQNDKTFLLPSKQTKKSPRIVFPCPGAICTYMYEIKQNIILNNEAKGIFLELVQNDGNNKSFKMLPELVPSGCIPMELFSNDDPGLTLTIFMIG